ncbi:MAG: zf-HC2 domain-containing protein [Ktedonobacteraceae bacterium]
MAQHNNEHLTMTQLSAYLDQELASGELALCTAHLHTCQPCQATLADLRLTSTLLHEMPQVEVPRSFVLPVNLVMLPTTPASEEQYMRPASRGQYIVKRSLRALSTIAAVIGLVFILAGALATVSHSSNSASTMMAPAQNVAHTAAQGSSTPRATPNRPAEQPSLTRTPAQTPTPQATPSNSPTKTPASLTNTGDNPPPSGLQSALDPSQPVGRLSIGLILLLLGILGILGTRRSQHAPNY